MIAKNPKLISVSLVIVMLAVLVTSCGTFSNPHGKLNENQYQSLVDEFEVFTASPNHIDPAYKKYADVKRFCALDILGMREKDGKTEIYAHAYDACYSYFKGKVYDGGGSGFSDICMITAEINGDSVKIADIWYPRDGAEYWKSIREKVPAGIQVKIKTYDRTEIHKRAEEQASQYFNAPFGKAMLNICFDEDKGQDVYQIIDDSFTTTESGILDENFVEEFEILKDYHSDPKSFSACAIDMQGYCENSKLWNDFYEQVQKHVDCNVIISTQTKEGDPIYIYLEYENGIFKVFEDDSHDRFGANPYYQDEYEFLIKEKTDDGTVYMLSSDPNCTYDELIKSYLSSQLPEINARIIIKTA